MGLDLVVYWGLIYIDGSGVEGYCEYRSITSVKQLEWSKRKESIRLALHYRHYSHIKGFGGPVI